MTADKPKHWAKWLPLTEWWYNTTFHSSLQLTPFEALYGYKPPQLGIPQEAKSNDFEVDQFLEERKKMLQTIKERLVQAQERVKFFADKNRTGREFQVGSGFFYVCSHTDKPH